MYSQNDWRVYSELYHHGILGQKWGIRRFQNSDGSLTEAGKQRYSKSTSEILHLPKRGTNDIEKMALKRIKNSSAVNIDKWGKTEDTNILYVTGLSGSGKSTVSTYLADDGKTDYLNLDSYLSQMSQESRDEWQDKRFNSYLDDNVPEWRNVLNSKTGKLNYQTVDKIASAMEEFSKEEYRNGRKVICDGVQIYTPTLYENSSSYNGKPVMVINTSRAISDIRGSIRDSESPLEAFQLAVERYSYSEEQNRILTQFKKDLGM